MLIFFVFLSETGYRNGDHSAAGRDSSSGPVITWARSSPVLCIHVVPGGRDTGGMVPGTRRINELPDAGIVQVLEGRRTGIR